MNDQLLNEISNLRPADNDWSTSQEGRGVMARAIAMGQASESVQSKSATRRLTRSRRITIAALGSGTVLIGGVAAASLAFRNADSPTQAGCYETLSAQADTTEAPRALVAEVGPVEACIRTFTELEPQVDVSNMVSCVNPYGGRGVFPAPPTMTPAEACRVLGWAVDAG